ncbi:MAG: FHA domain-containing protein [Bacteroidetes bacterium]|uniref:FHA domain-containing protein n=1 Tax=Candidatus Cryptobacteroides faecipullorum TaxID=2840764 RepID=A0A9D9I726_9BACT|nr:FHA domain-containing protein [Candidatus Cryptobacteroides faecipullorum]
MSSNKTIIPGMEDIGNERIDFGQTNSRMHDGTYIPQPFGLPASGNSGHKPVIGFLYSISKTSAGEYWPVKMGANTIGRSSECDVSLAEATVSEQHAILVVRQMKNPDRIIASICDSRSTCGTMINGESLGFDQKECYNGDIITIGEHYDLYFILIDAKQIGLNVCREFMPSRSGAESRFPESQSSRDPYSAPGYTNHNTRGFDQQSGSSQGGTVGMDEGTDKPGTKPGGTIFM